MAHTTIQFIVFKDGDLFIAQGLELDITTQGQTPEEAARRFEVVLNAEKDDAVKCGRSLFDIGPAPAAFQTMYAGVVSRQQMQIAA